MAANANPDNLSGWQARFVKVSKRGQVRLSLLVQRYSRQSRTPAIRLHSLDCGLQLETFILPDFENMQLLQIYQLLPGCMFMSEKTSVGIVGCGYWGPNLVRNFFEHPDVDLKYVCDLSPGRLARIERRYPTVKLVTDYNQLLEDAQLDAIAIATPVQTHFSLARQALSAGKHVLVEKPMCSTGAECLELVTLAEKRKLTLMVDHTFVYHGAVRRIKQEIEKGELGEILYFDSVRINLGLFQNDVNVVMDLAAHDISIMDYLLAKSPTHISATGASHTPGGLEDIAYVTMKFPNNLIGHFHVSWLSPVKIRQILIGGSRKMIVYDDLQTEKIRIYDKGISLPDEMADENRYHNLIQYRIGDIHIPVLEADEALKNEVAHFIKCLVTGQQPDSNGWSGLRVVSMLEFANAALQSGQTQVASFPSPAALSTGV
jgi:predicted dehydrogenase